MWHVNNERGFTLLELVIAMLIVGILMGSFVPKYIQNKTDQLLIEKTIMTIRSVQDAARWFYNDHQCFPNYFDGNLCSVDEVGLQNALNYLFIKTKDIYGNDVGEYLPMFLYTNNKIKTPLGDLNVLQSNNPNLFILGINGVEYDHAIKIRHALPNVEIKGSSGLVNITTTIPKPGYEAMLEGVRNEVKSMLKKMDITDFEYIGLLDHDSMIDKPVCRQDDPLTPEDERKIPQIFVVPYYFSAGKGGPLHGLVAYAEDKGNKWQVKGEVALTYYREPDGTPINPNDVSLLTIVTCVTPR